MKYILRKTTEQDIPRIVELSGFLADHHHGLDPYWKAGKETKATFGEFLKGELQKENTLWLVVESERTIIGYFSGELSPTNPAAVPQQRGHVSNAFILEKFRGKGVARAAVKQLFEWFKEKGATVAELTVDSRNVEGVRAWEGLGFKEYMKRMKVDL
jgi:ribosomal protein S18 acetylase RimI-like enzyme